MNPDPAHEPLDPMEVKLTALLLGELSEAEAAQVREAMVANPELTRLYARLERTIELVREAARTPAGAPLVQPPQPRLAQRRREELLAAFKTLPGPAPGAKAKTRNASRYVLALAALLVGALFLASLTLPALSKAKAKGMRVAANAEQKRVRLIERLGEATDSEAAAAAAAPTAGGRFVTRGEPGAAAPPLNTPIYLPTVQDEGAVASAAGLATTLTPGLAVPAEPPSVGVAVVAEDKNASASPPRAPMTDVRMLMRYGLLPKGMKMAESGPSGTATPAAGPTPTARSGAEVAGRTQRTLVTNVQSFWSLNESRSDDALARRGGAVVRGFTDNRFSDFDNDGLLPGEASVERYRQKVETATGAAGQGGLGGGLGGGIAARGTGSGGAGGFGGFQAGAMFGTAAATPMPTAPAPASTAPVVPPSSPPTEVSEEVVPADAAVPFAVPTEGFTEVTRPVRRVAALADHSEPGSTMKIIPQAAVTAGKPTQLAAAAPEARGRPALRPSATEPTSPPAQAAAEKVPVLGDTPTLGYFVTPNKDVAKGAAQAPAAAAAAPSSAEGTPRLARRTRLSSVVPEAVEAEGRPTSASVETELARKEAVTSLDRLTVTGTKTAESLGRDLKPEGEMGEAVAVVGQVAGVAEVRAVEVLAAAEDFAPTAQAEPSLTEAPVLREALALDAAGAAPRPPLPEPQPDVFTADNPFSTFSLNVTDVSYKLAAASLESGALPDPAGIRVEEFINAFDYYDPAPATGAPVALAWEQARYPFAHNRDLLRFSVQTAAQGREAGQPLNLVILLDSSGSMERADRVHILHEALRVLAAQLKPADRISVVAFARTARLWVDALPGSQAHELVERVGHLNPEGGTNLEDALKVGYATALRHFLRPGVNRLVLLTDGAANLGNVDPGALQQLVETHRQQGVALDCFGIGWEGYNDDLLEVLSRHGDGRYGFLNTPEEAATGFAAQLAGALQVAAADVKVQLEFNPHRVKVWRQLGYARHQLTKEQFRDNTVDAAELGAAESGNALYLVEVNPQGTGDLGVVRVRYRVPASGLYEEHEWALRYRGAATALEAASPTLRLAAVAGAFGEWLATSPFAAEVTPDRLLALAQDFPVLWPNDPRPQHLVALLRAAKAVSGR